jgi:N-acetylglutamate synthase
MSPPHALTAADIEAIERATLAAVAPQDVDEMPGWLLPFDAGTVGRAHSAVPLRHDASIRAADIASIVARYHARGMAPSLRIAAVPALAYLEAALIAQGLKATQPTLTCVARVADVLDATRAIAPAEVSPSPSQAWSQVYLGEGFDPVDGASRVRALSRATGSLYAHSTDASAGQPRVVATGVGSYGHGWLGIHGMRTLGTHRKQGHASRILRALALQAQARNLVRAYLQVEDGNLAALRLYESLGFALAWRYVYWRPC